MLNMLLLKINDWLVMFVLYRITCHKNKILIINNLHKMNYANIIQFWEFGTNEWEVI